MTNEEIAIKLAEHHEEIGSLKHRVSNCEIQNGMLNKLVTTTEKLALNMSYMAKEQEKQGYRLECLEREPNENFKYYKRLIVGCIITGISGSIIGAVLALILK